MKVIQEDWTFCKVAVANKAMNAPKEVLQIDPPKHKPYIGKRDAKELDTFLFNIEQYLKHLSLEDEP